MRNRTRLLLSALIAALTLSAAITTAHARRLLLSQQHFGAIWTTANPLEFTSTSATVRCAVTIEGSFHSATLSKVSGQLVGYVTSAHAQRPCTGGEAWVLNGLEVLPNGTRPTSLPWHIRYDSFIGALPNITRIKLQLVGAAFLLRVLTVGCLYLSTAARPAMGFVEREAGGIVTGLKPDEEAQVPLLTRLEGFLNCSSEGAFRSAAAAPVTIERFSTTRIRVTLVQ